MGARVKKKIGVWRRRSRKVKMRGAKIERERKRRNETATEGE